MSFVRCRVCRSRHSRHGERESSRTGQKIRIDWSVGANRRFDKLQSTPSDATLAWIVCPLDLQLIRVIIRVARTEFERVKRVGNNGGNKGWTVINAVRYGYRRLATVSELLLPFLVRTSLEQRYRHFLCALRNIRLFRVVFFDKTA